MAYGLYRQAPTIFKTSLQAMTWWPIVSVNSRSKIGLSQLKSFILSTMTTKNQLEELIFNKENYYKLLKEKKLRK